MVLHRTNLERLTLIMNHNSNLSMKTLPKSYIKLLGFVNLAAAMTRSSLVMLAEGRSAVPDKISSCFSSTSTVKNIFHNSMSFHHASSDDLCSLSLYWEVSLVSVLGFL